MVTLMGSSTERQRFAVSFSTLRAADCRRSY